MLVVPAVRASPGWGATKGLLCALAILASGCSSVGGEGSRYSAQAKSAAGAPVELSSAHAAPKAGAAWQAERPSSGVPAEKPESQSNLSEPEFYRGSGNLVRLRSEGTAEAPVFENGQISLNFVDVDIREVVDVVLGETLNLSYIIDPEVQGTVVARTSGSLDVENVIPALESILELNGAALRLVEGIYHIMPLEKAVRSLAEPRVALSRRARALGFTVSVIPLRYASAHAVHRVAANFISAEQILLVDQTRNLLIFAGTATETDNLEDLVRLFDVDWMAGMSFGLFPVEIAEVTNLVFELEQVFGQDAEGAPQNVIRFVPIARMNAILAITSQQTYLDRAKLWVERLDRGGGASGRQIYVYYVQNSRAAELAEVLTQIFTIERTTVKASGDVLAPGLTPIELSTPASAIGEQLSQAEVEGAEGPPPAFLSEHASYAGGGQASLVGTESVGALISETGDIRVIADEKNNALVILATPAEYRMIESTLRRLDLIPLQVLIEATIAEVTLNDNLEYGVEWFFSQGDFTVNFSESASGAVSSAFPGFSALFSQTDAQVVLNALTEITDIKVISSPQLMVLDNESAFLNVGDQVPIVTQSSVSQDDPSAPIVNSVQYRETGVLLEITPRVNSSGLVVLDIVQEVSDAIQTQTSTIDSPTIQMRRIETNVVVQSGETVALGGLIRDNQTDSITGIPLLSDIPILGNLFKTTSKTFFRTELIILITPHVIHNVAEATEAMEELRSRLTGLVPLELEQLIKQTPEPPMTQ
jgi:general secretion pathway protein D